MKHIYVVEIDIPAEFVVDPSADVEAIKEAIWEMFPNLPLEAITVTAKASGVPDDRYAVLDALVADEVEKQRDYVSQVKPPSWWRKWNAKKGEG